MAKNHLLPRHLLWLALCVCGLLGSSFLNGTRIARINTDFLAIGARYDAPVNGQTDRDLVMRRIVESTLDDPRLSVRSVSSVVSPLREVYRNEIGVREATGSNDGPRVAEYLRYCGLDEGYAWCAAFVSWCHGQAGYAEPRNPWSPALFPEKRVVLTKALADAARHTHSGTHPIPRQGDVFGIYYTNLKRIGHVGFVDGWGDTYCLTVEGNAGPEGAIDANGNPANPIRAGPSADRVYSKRRPIRTIHAVARWADTNHQSPITNN